MIEICGRQAGNESRSCNVFSRRTKKHGLVVRFCVRALWFRVYDALHRVIRWTKLDRGDFNVFAAVLQQRNRWNFVKLNGRPHGWRRTSNATLGTVICGRDVYLKFNCMFCFCSIFLQFLIFLFFYKSNQKLKIINLWFATWAVYWCMLTRGIRFMIPPINSVPSSTHSGSEMV